MLHKTLVAVALVAAFAVPAFAAGYGSTSKSTTATTKTTSTTTVASFYVEQSSKTHRCYVVAHKPNGKTMMEIGTTSYPTRAKASAAMKAAPECKVTASMSGSSTNSMSTTTTTKKPKP